MAYWMITNRDVTAKGLGIEAKDLTYWQATEGPLTSLNSWKRVTLDAFKKALVASANKFPLLRDVDDQENQKHVTLFVHGYNNSWKDAAARYEGICQNLYSGPDSLGECILFTWPSNAEVQDYLPDRADARKSAAAFADVLSLLYDWMSIKQAAAVNHPKLACRAKVSIVAHSMGNYLLQHAMQVVWSRKNQPLQVSLVNQLVMAAADVDNDIFNSGEVNDKSDGDAIANLTYRVTALYSGLDQVLGASAGLKHFGKRRLGRSGLDGSNQPDNVWHIDCTPIFEADAKRSKPTHSAYFINPKTMTLIRHLLRGVDRRVLEAKGLTKP